MPDVEATPLKSTEDHSYSSQANQEQGVNPSTATNNLSSSIALTQADPTQSQLESTTMDMDLQITDDQEGFILITNKKRRHSSDSVISKSTIQTPEHPVGLTVIFSPTNSEQSLMTLSMNKVSDAFELHCPECFLMDVLRNITCLQLWKFPFQGIQGLFSRHVLLGQTLREGLKEDAKALEGFFQGFSRFHPPVEICAISVAKAWRFRDSCIELSASAAISPTMAVALVCDSKAGIIYIDPSMPGEAHDSYVWKRSFLRRAMQSGFLQPGDSGYGLAPWLITPVPGTLQPNSTEARFTVAHCSVWSALERCIGLLKIRFCCLQKHRTLYHIQETAATIIAACAVLHNFCIAAGEPEPETEEETT
ncbi:hypothetical protein HPB47_007870 [Ixodes persulcatus]|uniref:Uncharacterized protein n=1 Tax=Ixodes persulcatus TaxID=34615 RepID=A0AC60P6L4_IXOPE|nr:hypothetical protein HPB47_007870 [Ixodes persulcatus]